MKIGVPTHIKSTPRPFLFWDVKSSVVPFIKIEQENSNVWVLWHRILLHTTKKQNKPISSCQNIRLKPKVKIKNYKSSGVRQMLSSAQLDITSDKRTVYIIGHICFLFYTWVAGARF